MLYGQVRRPSGALSSDAADGHGIQIGLMYHKTCQVEEAFQYPNIDTIGTHSKRVSSPSSAHMRLCVSFPLGMKVFNRSIHPIIHCLSEIANEKAQDASQHSERSPNDVHDPD